jgi:hypothetical protein
MKDYFEYVGILAETIDIQYNIKTIIIKNTKYLNYLLMSSGVKPDQTKCKECGKLFDTTEGLQQHYKSEHK